MSGIGRRRAARSVALAALWLAACERLRDEPQLPTVEEVAAHYETAGIDGEFALSGNVLEIRIRQERAQLERGGSLWAKVGPYIYLFSPATQQAFEAFPAIAAIRVITSTPGGGEVARAMLRRDTLGELRWQRALNVLGRALQEGTQRPSRIEDLVQWGEQHTEYQYSADWVQ